MPIILPQGLEITGKQAVDSRLLLSKQGMREINDNLMPARYFSICVEDGLIYLYSKDNEVDPELGKFRLSTKQLEVDIQTALEEIDLLNANKEDSISAKISSFFESHPDFNYKFLLSIADQPVEESMDYLRLVAEEYEISKPGAWIPFDIGTMALVVKFNSFLEAEAMRVYVPKFGQLISISTLDYSGLVKFAYTTVGDESKTAEWGNISGNIKDQEDLGEDFLSNDNYISRTEIEDLFG